MEMNTMTPCEDCIVFAMCNTKIKSNPIKDLYFLSRLCTTLYDWLYGRDISKRLYKERVDLIIQVFGGMVHDYYFTQQHRQIYNEYSM